MKEKKLYPLILQAKQDQKAQTKLINLYWSDVFGFVMQKTQNENTADEITVSVFSKVLTKLELFDPQFEFKTWILTIAQNTIIDYWRKNSKNKDDATEYLENRKNDFAQSPEEILISKEQQKKILSIIESLDTKYQEIIRLRFYEEKSIKEISEELGISLSNAKVRIMRSKNLLIQLLNINEFYHE